jgi:hypothetical protein
VVVVPPPPELSGVSSASPDESPPEDCSWVGSFSSLAAFAFTGFFVGLKMSWRLPSGRRSASGSASAASATIGSVASTPPSSVVAAAGGAGTVGSGSWVSRTGTAASAPTRRIATGQRRRRTSWRQMSVIGFISGLLRSGR